ncbi:MAG: CRISPR-associated protein Csx15 [bacterium]
MTQKSFSMHPGIQANVQDPMTMDFGQGFEQQVRSYFEKTSNLRGIKTFGLPGQATAAILSLPVLEMSVGLPTMFLFGFGREIKVVGELNLANYRHNIVRPRRNDCPEGEVFSGWTVLDGAGRGIENYQLAEIVEIVGVDQDNIRIIDVSVGHVDPADPTKGLVDRLIESGLTKIDWTSGRIVFLPPGFGPLAVVMATTIYGLSEVWPRTVRLNRRDDGTFHVDEVLDPQSLRQFGTELIKRWVEAIPAVTMSGKLPDGFEGELRTIAKRFGVKVR